MPTYEITAPDGKTYEVTAPEGASEEQVLQYVQSQTAQQPTPAAQGGEVNPPGTMVGRAATQAVKDTLEVPVRAAGAALRGTVGGLVDLANISPQIANLLPGTQGVQPITQQPFLGSADINRRLSPLGELATAETSLGKVADVAGELAAGFMPLTKVTSLPGEKLVQQAKGAIQAVTPSLSGMWPFTARPPLSSPPTSTSS